MSVFLTDLLEVSLGCGAVIALLLLLTPILSKRFSPRWRYWAWLLIALRLALPGISLGGDTIPAPIQAELPQRITAPTYDGMRQDIKDALPYGYKVNGNGVDNNIYVGYRDDQGNRIQAYDNPVFRLEGYNGNWSLSFHWDGVWKLGLILCLGWQAYAYLSFHRRVKRWSTPADTAALAALEAQKQTLGIDANITLVRCEVISSPLLMGFVKPTILLPARLSGDVLEPTLAHELTHFKRKDLWYKLLMVLVRGLHWFNPLVWLMVRQAGLDVELCCDYDLLKNQGEAARRAYGQAILDQMMTGQSTSSLTTGFSGDKKSIFTRFKAIMDTSPKKKGTAILVLILCAAVLAGGLIAFTGHEDSAADTSIGEELHASIVGDPTQLIVTNYYEQGFDWDYSDLPTLTITENSASVRILMPPGYVPRNVRYSVNHYHADDPYEINKIDLIEKDSQIYTLPKNHNVFEIPVARANAGAEEHMFIFLTWGEDSQFRYVFRVDFAAPVPAVTAYLDDREDEAITASYYPDGFQGGALNALPTLYATGDSVRLTIQPPNGVTAPVYLGKVSYSGTDIPDAVSDIEFQEVSFSTQDGDISYAPNAEFSISLLGLDPHFTPIVFFLTLGEESQFHYAFQVKAKPNPELTLTDAFDRYPSGPFSVSATEQDGIPYYKFENASAGLSILMPEDCQADPSIISYRGKTITTLLPCNPLSGYLYGNAGGIASFAAVDLTGDGKDELLYLWGYGGTGVWEDQCKIFDLSTMEELPVSPLDEELLAKYVQAELLEYEDDYAGIFRITTADGTVTYGSTTAQDTAQPLGPVELRFDGYTHLNLEGNQLKMSLAFSPVSDGTFMYAMSYLGDLTGTLTYSPSLRAFTPSPPFTMELYDPIEYQP